MEAVRDFWKSFTVSTYTLWVIGMVGALIILAATLGGVSAALIDLQMLLSGKVQQITRMPMGTAALPILLTLLALHFITCLIAGIALPKKIGGHAHKMDFEENALKFSFCAIVGSGFEEVIFRWLPFGLLTKISFLSGTTAFYCLLLVVNAIFAVGHLFNYEDERDRKIIRVLPQLISGILFSYAFIKYGLAASILVHCSINALNCVFMWLCTEDQ